MQSTILIVDDDRSYREEMRDLLADQYEIHAVSSGEEALEYLSRPNITDLILLDVRLSGTNGLDLLKKIKKSYPDILVAISTGFSSKDTAIQALKNQADDYFEKQSDPEEIKKSISRILQKKKGFLEVGRLDIRGKIEKVKDFLERNKYKMVSLEEAAGLVCLSPKYLSRKFKEIEKRSFNQFRIDLKITEARRLLAETGYTVENISDKMAYLNPESFVRIFKKYTGKTPHGYRDSVKRKYPVSSFLS